MALRKRSYRSGKLLATAFHNARVEHQNGRKAGQRDRSRKESVRARLKGEGIHESWTDEAVKIMDEHGYGVNQIGSRVIPILSRRMREHHTELQDASAEAAKKAAEKEASAARKAAVPVAARNALDVVHDEMSSELAELKNRVDVLLVEGSNSHEQRSDLLKTEGGYFFVHQLGTARIILRLALEAVCIGAICFVVVAMWSAGAEIGLDSGWIATVSLLVAAAYAKLRVKHLQMPKLRMSRSAVHSRFRSLLDAETLEACRSSTAEACRRVRHYAEWELPHAIRSKRDEVNAVVKLLSGREVSDSHPRSHA
ncbi:MAG: hypothetical protein E5W91_29510 [Mesorhizobium sp.]|uniref:hypothetical protein n=1 Tax=Mesorhizobium sp. TaxID=1871066 RepID=UPI0012290DFF|nr:hypothetical protein [Mesorhizobium sp.]TIS53794.1 MAG: hypothetical protein E5W91_29510 [Mesorhizobium sp.]